MIAYSEFYLDLAMDSLGEMCDYVCYQLDMDLDEFFKLFLHTKIAERFGKGDTHLIAGMSGTELALQVLDTAGMEVAWEKRTARVEYTATDAYWCGWILAYYQWKTGRDFAQIYPYLSMAEIRRMYAPMHEASEEKFVDEINKKIRFTAYASKLQELRRRADLSQRELSELSGVNLRTLQEYESGRKEIRKAAVCTAIALAKALHCSVDQLVS